MAGMQNDPLKWSSRPITWPLTLLELLLLLLLLLVVVVLGHLLSGLLSLRLVGAVRSIGIM